MNTVRVDNECSNTDIIGSASWKLKSGLHMCILIVSYFTNLTGYLNLIKIGNYVTGKCGFKGSSKSLLRSKYKHPLSELKFLCLVFAYCGTFCWGTYFYRSVKMVPNHNKTYILVKYLLPSGFKTTILNQA